MLKGILTAEDARLAVEHGAAAVWVSNHGARQLDRSPASIDVLEEIVGAVAGRAEVYLDGGVRRGIDVVTALALGARAVFLGRPILYALAADGEAGVSRSAVDDGCRAAERDGAAGHAVAGGDFAGACGVMVVGRLSSVGTVHHRGTEDCREK